MLRFFVQRLNPDVTIQAYEWIAESAINLLAEFDEDGELTFTLQDQAEQTILDAKIAQSAYFATGIMSDALIESALLLATLDPIFRAGVGHESIGVIYDHDVLDLKNLIEAVDANLFVAKNRCVLNPTFGQGSHLVGGADADLIIDDTLIDIKTTKNFSLARNALNQVLGYYILHYIDGIDGVVSKPSINNVAIYFSRHSYLHVMPLSELINLETFPEFVEWFQLRAAKAFPAKKN